MIFDQPGADREVEPIMVPLGHGDQADFAAQAAGVVHINVGYLTDADSRDVHWRYSGMKGESSQNAQLVTRIDPVYVKRGVSFGIAGLLRFGESLLETRAGTLHL